MRHDPLAGANACAEGMVSSRSDRQEDLPLIVPRRPARSKSRPPGFEAASRWKPDVMSRVPRDSRR